MKKYLKLTSNEAIRHFILKDKTLIPEASAEIAHKLKDLDELKSEISVSIVMPTHRTKPDYDIDVIQLKNLVNETEKALYERLDKRVASVIVENIKEAQEHIDYSLNLDGLVLYANEYFSSVVKLPVELSTSVLIGPDFDLSPLYKTSQQNSRYYILTISRNVIRMIEAFNDWVIKEIDNNDFPFVNRDYYTYDPEKLMQDTFEENQFREYFNDADKLFHTYYNDNPLPVLLAGDVKMTARYEEQMDRDCMVIAKIHGSFDKMSHHDIIKIVAPEVDRIREEKQQEYSDRMDTAESGYLLSTDINEIYRSALNGSVDTLFIGENFLLNGTIEDDYLNVSRKKPDEVNQNDLLSVIMRIVRDNGGETIFVNDDRMYKYNGIAVVRRY